MPFKTKVHFVIKSWGYIMFPSYLGRAECLNWNDTFGMTQYTIALRTPLPTSYFLPLPNVLLWFIRKDFFFKWFFTNLVDFVRCFTFNYRQPTKGQTKSKWFFQADVSSKKQTNKFNFTTMRLVFVYFLEEIEDTKNTFRN